eukprot:tig00001033_g6492.t1
MSALKGLAAALEADGWPPISVDRLQEHLGAVTAAEGRSAVLNVDLRKLQPAEQLPKDINSAKNTELKAPVVLQVLSVKNICQPSIRQEANENARMLRLELTDGNTKCVAIEFKRCLEYQHTMTKPQVRNGIICLEESNTKLLGGRVEELAKKYEEEKRMQIIQRARGTGAAAGNAVADGPPPFRPFAGRQASAAKAGKAAPPATPTPRQPAEPRAQAASGGPGASGRPRPSEPPLQPRPAPSEASPAASRAGGGGAPPGFERPSSSRGQPPGAAQAPPTSGRPASAGAARPAAQPQPAATPAKAAPPAAAAQPSAPPAAGDARGPRPEGLTAEAPRREKGSGPGPQTAAPAAEPRPAQQPAAQAQAFQQAAGQDGARASRKKPEMERYTPRGRPSSGLNPAAPAFLLPQPAPPPAAPSQGQHQQPPAHTPAPQQPAPERQPRQRGQRGGHAAQSGRERPASGAPSRLPDTGDMRQFPSQFTASVVCCGVGLIHVQSAYCLQLVISDAEKTLSVSTAPALSQSLLGMDASGVAREMSTADGQANLQILLAGLHDRLSGARLTATLLATAPIPPAAGAPDAPLASGAIRQAIGALSVLSLSPASG